VILLQLLIAVHPWAGVPAEPGERIARSRGFVQATKPPNPNKQKHTEKALGRQALLRTAQDS